MRILVTGAGGFIGSHLVEHCLAEGADVVALVRYNSRNAWGWLEEIGDQPRLEVVTGDVRDFDSAKIDMAKFRERVTIHTRLGTRVELDPEQQQQ